MSKFVEFKIGNEIIKKNKAGHSAKKLRGKSLQNRTKAELWAEQIINQMIPKFEVIAEYPFQFRRFDFFFNRIKVALEIDGGYHEKEKQKAYDLLCDKYLYENYRITVFRVKNFETNSLVNYLNQIKMKLASTPIEEHGYKHQKRGGRKARLRWEKRQKTKSFKKKRVREPQLSKVFVPRTILRKKMSQ